MAADTKNTTNAEPPSNNKTRPGIYSIIQLVLVALTIPDTFAWYFHDGRDQWAGAGSLLATIYLFPPLLLLNIFVYFISVNRYSRRLILLGTLIIIATYGVLWTIPN